jgi:hypothetical protein
MITLVSTPEYIEQVSPEIVCRWVATESPNNFRLLRHDWDIVTAVSNGGNLRLTVAAGTFTGVAGDQITVFNQTLNAMYLGTVQAGSTTTTIDTDIPFITGFDPSDPVLVAARNFTYLNDNTQRAGYYFEGRLTINGVLNNLTIIASPDSFGYADLDVSGILRIVTSLGKNGDYTALIMAETNKSGNFYLEYRDCWYTSLTNDWVIAEGVGSPAVYPLWYYAEAVRSEEQGSNLHEFEPDDLNCAPFFNSFENPVYFAGLPFDLSFILPERALLSPAGEITVTIRTYNRNNTLLSEIITPVAGGTLEGHVCSLNIAPAGIEAQASYFTAEITAP